MTTPRFMVYHYGSFGVWGVIYAPSRGDIYDGSRSVAACYGGFAQLRSYYLQLYWAMDHCSRLCDRMPRSHSGRLLLGHGVLGLEEALARPE